MICKMQACNLTTSMRCQYWQRLNLNCIFGLSIYRIKYVWIINKNIIVGLGSVISSVILCFTSRRHSMAGMDSPGLVTHWLSLLKTTMVSSSIAQLLSVHQPANIHRVLISMFQQLIENLQNIFQARCWMMISVGLILSLLVHNNFCHVALTFPPARNLNLDFLDNVRYAHSFLCVDD